LFEQDGADETLDGGFDGEAPMASVRRLISPFSRSIGLVECSLVRSGLESQHTGSTSFIGLLHG
jgi:hypothetical protein